MFEDLNYAGTHIKRKKEKGAKVSESFHLEIHPLPQLGMPLALSQCFMGLCPRENE